jgi:hypothetical protein
MIVETTHSLTEWTISKFQIPNSKFQIRTHVEDGNPGVKTGADVTVSRRNRVNNNAGACPRRVTKQRKKSTAWQSFSTAQ